MAYFECIVGNGGGGQTDIPLIVNCDAQFAGLTITATQGLLSYTETCPSTSPYEVVFHLPQDGTWTISGTLSGQTYSDSITISAFEMYLIAGFNWRAWVTAGGLDPTDYSDLSDVFADEAAVRRLMLVHASADYLIDRVSDDVDTLDDFVVNDTAMKWLGLCDYVCDGIRAITGAEAKLLNSTYWERYLKDHVPVMTSNTAPYGTASDSSNRSGYEAWHAFDGSDSSLAGCSTSTTSGAYFRYQFTNPIAVKRISFIGGNSSSTINSNVATLEASNDGNNWETIKDDINIVYNHLETVDVENNVPYIYWQIKQKSTNVSVQYSLFSLQFYGRALNVTIPVMTGDTAPYGVATSSTPYQSNAYAGFNNLTTYGCRFNTDSLWLQYEFTQKFLPKMIGYTLKTNANTDVGTLVFKASEDGVTFDTIADTGSHSYNTTLYTAYVDISSNTTEYKVFKGEMQHTSRPGTPFLGFQIYGLDYSEKEFESGSTKKWIYDHGLELEPISEAILDGGTVTFGNDYIEVNRTNGSANCSAATDNQIDLTPYDLAFAIVEDVSGSFLYHICAMSSRTAGVSAATASVSESTAGPDVKGGLDISAVDQTQYIGIYAGNVTKYRIKEAWLTA